ncbi:MAG: feruloyl-CoA synthase [Hyphomicrobiaceae bacterium]|nr:MAG: feruloyl-CoA synthase [Hyphomicrobiaceae bacterium]
MGNTALAGTTATPNAVSDEGNALFAKPAVQCERRPDGSMILSSGHALGSVPSSIGALLERRAVSDPDRVFLAERDASGAWRKVTYDQASRAANAIGQALIDRSLGPDRPLMILAENGIDHALIALGAMHIGVPVVPVSTAYARLSQDFGKLRYIYDLITPGLIYVDEADRYAKALETIGATRLEIVASRGKLGAHALTPFSTLAELRPTPAVDAAFARVGPDTVAKILFTSGSTGQPKGVINTQRMLCANQESIVAAWPFLAARPPVIVDWLPWNHTFGANHNFNMMLRHGGTLYIDEGKPVPGLIERTIANLRDVSPTVYFNVPRGYAALLDYLEKDEELQRKFFERLDMLFYAAAALPQSLWDRLEALARKVRGRPVPFVSSWGLTETAPLATIVHYPIDRPGNIGVPGPGIQVKLAPVSDKLEIRVKGPNVTPGYFKDPEVTKAAFDEEGWFKTGDAVRLADPADPVRGLLFDGRTAENFKLLSGTWVNVGMLRTAVIAAGAPVIEDAVVAGHDRDEVGLLVFPSLAGLRSLCPELGAAARLDDLLRAPAVRDALVRGLSHHNAQAQGTSMRIRRCVLLSESPSIDANEITDKGYLNQRAVLTKRATTVERLYTDPPPPEVILIN